MEHFVFQTVFLILRTVILKLFYTKYSFSSFETLNLKVTHEIINSYQIMFWTKSKQKCDRLWRIPETECICLPSGCKLFDDSRSCSIKYSSKVKILNFVAYKVFWNKFDSTPALFFFLLHFVTLLTMNIIRAFSSSRVAVNWRLLKTLAGLSSDAEYNWQFYLSLKDENHRFILDKFENFHS